MNTGLLLLRLLIGGLLFAHGAQKAFGAFGGMGVAGTAPLFETWGLRPGAAMVKLAAAAELTAAALLITGLATPLGAAIAAGTLIVAGSVNATNGLWAVKGGFELPLLYAGTAACLAFTGPGDYSLDRAIGLSDDIGVATGVSAVVLAVVASGVVISRARANLAKAAPTAAAGGAH
ncbi:DoxX family protein [Flexivirga meconopsidis]|uniref:DoxX family protein n=1 Tax=Flexivirga meconopsidis TaxID=2977121 RepID=UPI002240D504|nr:DoxX family protein [Flexivirga meconopsidis]